MKRKIVVSFLMMALVCALVGGATFAMFTDQSTNAVNTFSAGTVDVNAGAQVVIIPVAGMAPGDTISGTFAVTNSGTLDAWFKVTANKAAVAGKTNIFEGATPAVVTFDNVAWTKITPSTTATTVNFSVALPVAANNDYQGAAGTLSFTVDSEQYANNIK